MLIQVLITVAVAMSIAQLQLCLTQGGGSAWLRSSVFSRVSLKHPQTPKRDWRGVGMAKEEPEHLPRGGVSKQRDLLKRGWGFCRENWLKRSRD